MIKQLLLLLLLPTLVFARHRVNHVPEGVKTPAGYEPWFTGPFLAPTPVNMELGHPSIEPALVVSYNYGAYTNNWGLTSIDGYWGINYSVDYQFAFTPRTGLETIVGGLTNTRDGKSSTHFQDTQFLFGYQISNDEKGTWVPDFRLLMTFIVPTGKYQNFDLKLPELDFTGNGALFVGPNLSVQKLFYLPKSYVYLQWSLGYFVPTRVKVKGFNAYGGGVGAKGSLRPGQNLIAYFSGQYSLSQRWSLMFDSSYEFRTKTTDFRGKPGFLLDGTPSTIGRPTFHRFALALETSYSFSARSGLFWGLWGSFAGQNAEAFGSAFLAYVYIF